MSSITLEHSEIVGKTMAVVFREKAIPTRATTNLPGLCNRELVPFPLLVPECLLLAAPGAALGGLP